MRKRRKDTIAIKPQDILRVPDGGISKKGKPIQRGYTIDTGPDTPGIQLLVQGGSRLYYSVWEVPQHLVPDGLLRSARRESLGSAYKVDYTDALIKHLRLHANIKKGIYPEHVAGRQRQSGHLTFGNYATERVRVWAAQRKNAKDAQGMINMLPRYCGEIFQVPIKGITSDHVIRVLEPIWHSKPTTAEEIRNLIARILKAAAVQGKRDHSEPASMEAMKAVLGPLGKRRGGKMRALKYEDMSEFMAELRAMKTQIARALEVLILSNMRTAPVRFLHIDHLNFKKAVWTVPSELMKVDEDSEDFEQPMSPRLVAVLKEQITYLQTTYPDRPLGLIWPGDPSQIADPLTQPISENAMRDLLVYVMQRKATPHGFRATFKTWAGNQLHPDGISKRFDKDAVEYCLAHNPGNPVERAYRRDTLWIPRVAIMKAWADYLAPKKLELKIVK